jgi:mannose-6-phosphate isomerase-like protein (cupin superfamily)
MKAFQIREREAGIVAIEPLPLPSIHRKGDSSAEYFRQQARGEVPKAEQNLSPASFLRTIRYDDGEVSNLATEPGSLLNILIAGRLTIDGGGALLTLEPGDVLLAESAVLSRVRAAARDHCRLVQLGVAPNWPGPSAQLQPPGTHNPRRSSEPNLKRVLRDADDQAYLVDFPELFAAAANSWSAKRPVVGFRLLCWEDGNLDWHPEVINNFGIFLSGEMEIETGGHGGRIELFHAGDICTAEDRTGIGHIDRCRGMTHVVCVVLANEHLW